MERALRASDHVVAGTMCYGLGSVVVVPSSATALMAPRAQIAAADRTRAEAPAPGLEACVPQESGLVAESRTSSAHGPSDFGIAGYP